MKMINITKCIDILITDLINGASLLENAHCNGSEKVTSWRHIFSVITFLVNGWQKIVFFFLVLDEMFAFVKMSPSTILKIL